MAAAVAVMSMTGCRKQKFTELRRQKLRPDRVIPQQRLLQAAREKITLRIGSGHSRSNPWITALEDYFVKECYGEGQRRDKL